MIHELWEDPDDSPYTFLLAGPLGDDARAMLTSSARLTWTVEAASHFEAMTKYDEYRDWGPRSSDFEELVRRPYPTS